MMVQRVNMKGREQSAYMRYHQDGLADLLIGLGVLVFGAFMLFDQDFPFAAVWVVLWVPIWMSAKRSITARRMQSIEASAEQHAGMLNAGVFVTGVLLLTVVAGMLVLWAQVTGNIPATFLAGLREYLMVVLGMAGASVLGVAAWLSRLGRLYAYAAVTAVAFVGGYLLGAPIALAVAAVGGIISLWGFGLLIRFVRKCPEQTE